nr:hypothetical protein DBT53_10455 [Aerococcus mictus]RAW03962.1 hypothetical protein DBT41_10195 [Aerococcus urinae]
MSAQSRAKKRAEIVESERTRLYRRMQLRAQGFRCFYCQCPLSHPAATADHLQARAKKGATTYDNIRAACGRCNGLKGTTGWKQFLAWAKGTKPAPTLDVWLIAIERRIWERTWQACDRIAAQVGIDPIAAVLEEDT